MKDFFIGIGLLILGLGLGFLLKFVGLFEYQFFAPKYENARREVFENTQSYVEGKRQDLIRYRLQYNQAPSTENKNAIKSTIRLMFSNVDPDIFEPQLASFLKDVLYN